VSRGGAIIALKMINALYISW